MTASMPSELHQAQSLSCRAFEERGTRTNLLNLGGVDLLLNAHKLDAAGSARLDGNCRLAALKALRDQRNELCVSFAVNGW